MGSFFITAGLAGGVALASIPVLLHLFMKQTPKHVIFPALRLVRERQKRSKKRMRIKNWLLLLARMALLALMALALARPRIWSKSSAAGADVPKAMAFVFDTSLSMGYKERDEGRLDEAKKRALGVIERLGESSRLYIIDSAEPIAPAALSPAAARKRIQGLVIRPVNRLLNSAVGQAYKAVAAAEQARHEVYVFTDLARTSWDPTRAAEGLGTARADKTNVATFVVRVAPKDLHDAAVVEAAPEAGFVARDEPVPIRAVIRSTGPAAHRLVEFFVEGQKRGQKEVDIPPNGEAEVRFTAPKLGVGARRAEVRLGGEPDPLAGDDQRFLTLDVQSPLKVLVVAEQDVDADFVEFALDPLKFRSGGGRPFPVTRVTPAQLVALTAPLKDFAAVFVLNVTELPAAEWGRLTQYVSEGGGLVLALGDRVLPDAWNQSAAPLLPAAIGDLREPKDPDFTFGKADISHPLFAHDGEPLGRELLSIPIAKYRAATPIVGARTILSYRNDEPALIERVFPGAKAGRSLLWTTALSRRAGNTAAEIKAAWNEFPIRGWSFFAVVNQTVPYLAGLTGRKLDYEAGEDVTLPIEPGRKYTVFSIQGPGADSAEKLNDPITGGALLLSAPPVIGPWTIQASGQGGKPSTLAFSVNFPLAETQLAPLTEPELATLFGGKEHYRFIGETEDVRVAIIETIIGRELFPYMMALILLLITFENILANTFYKERATTTTTPAPAQHAAL